jgi:hypothetical protein
MADQIYKVRDPQGNIREIRGPAGASDAEVIAQAKRLFAASQQTAPSAPPGQIPGAGSYVAPPAAPAGPTTRQRVAQIIGPTIEGLGTVGGAALATPAGPLAMLGGAGAGYSAARGINRLIAGDNEPITVPQALERTARETLSGATMEAAGRGVVGPAFAKIAEYGSRLGNIKLDTYLKALENKGDDILAALRGQRAVTPGAIPAAGEVAATAGTPGFATLQARAAEVPGLAGEYAFMQAQTATAQRAQQARGQEKAGRVLAQLERRMETALQPANAEDVGSALFQSAEAKRQALKANVIEPAYQAAFKEAGDSRIDLASVVRQAEEILGKKLSEFDPSTAPETVRKLAQLVKRPEPVPLGRGDIAKNIFVRRAPETPTATLQQLDDIRKAVNADIAAGKLSSDPAAATRLRNLGQIHSAIDNAVSTSTTLSDAAKQKYSAALNLYREQYVPQFKTGVNAQLFRTTGLNEPKIKPEDVVVKYFQPRGVSEAQNFVTMFGKDPDAMRVMRSGIEDLYTREVGKFTPEAHAAFLKKYADPIRVLDDAGMNTLQRINIVGVNAARHAKVQEIAERANIKLSDPLPAGATADAVQSRINQLTKGLTPQQLSHINAVQQDLLRSGEYERLVKAGAATGIEIKGLGTETGREIGLPLPNVLNFTITVFNNTAKRLALRLDNKLALEIAREMTDPALAARSVEKALQLQRQRATGGGSVATQLQPERLGRAVTTTAGVEIAPRAEPVRSNSLAPQSVNALAP